jgi:hypothetical protein
MFLDPVVEKNKYMFYLKLVFMPIIFIFYFAAMFIVEHEAKLNELMRDVWPTVKRVWNTCSKYVKTNIDAIKS